MFLIPKQIFSSQTSSQFNGFLSSADVKRMLKGKDFDAILAGFIIVAAFISRATRHSIEPLFRALHVTYADVLSPLLHSRTPLYYSSFHGLSISESIEKLKAVSKQLLEHHDGVNMIDLKFPMLDRIFKDSERFGDLRLLDAYPFELFNYTIKNFIRMTFMGKGTSIGKTVRAVSYRPDSFPYFI